ncbi:MAG TPA: Zn-ribbon domain-containing OB-fold protein [Tepidiformaceae bacterium]|nr:Zn-ribbon domain-containing OB-fold protein [Tepidiformaceae bacterium]
MSYRKTTAPIPVPIPTTAPFWAATRQHKLLLQRCESGHVFYYGRTHCPECLSNQLAWIEASGRGRIYSYTVARRPQSPEFAEDVPYIIVAITLEEGPRITSLLVEADPDNVQIESPVEVTWDDVSEDISMPYFRPTSP